MDIETLKIQQKTLTAISAFSIGRDGATLEEVLEKCLVTVLNLPWLPVKKMGAVFLTDKSGENLKMVRHLSLSTPLLTLCAKVPFGKCICGRAAATKQVIFTPCVDEHHEITFDEMVPHGHYAVPLLGENDKVVGNIILYTSHGHKENEDESIFLESVGRIVGGIVERAYRSVEVDELKKRDTLNKLIISMSHEINNPLMVGLASINKFMKMGNKDVLLDNTKLAFDRIAGQLRRLQSLPFSNLDEVEYTQDQDMFDLHESMEYNHKILTAIDKSYCLSITDRSGVIVYANRRFYKTHGFSSDELIGQKHSVLKSGVHDEAYFKEMWDTILDGKVWQGVVTNKSKGGGAVTLNIRIIPIDDYFIALKWDI